MEANQKVTENNPPISPLLDNAQTLYANGEYSRALLEVAQFISSSDQTLVMDACALSGLCQFQLGNYKEAESFFEPVAKANNKAGDWFNVCTSATMSGHIEHGKDAFDKALDILKKDTTITPSAVVNLRSYYMQALIDMKEYQRAFEQLEALKEFYVNSPVSDLTYLATSSGGLVPSIESTLQASEPILTYLGKEKAGTWLDSFASKLDEDGKRAVLSFK